MEAIEKAGYTGKIKIGMDVAASEFYKDGGSPTPRLVARSSSVCSLRFICDLNLRACARALGGP